MISVIDILGIALTTFLVIGMTAGLIELLYRIVKGDFKKEK